MARPTLSLVLPLYNEEEVLPFLHQRLQEFLGKLGLECEVIFVNDGSNDKTMDLLRDLATKDLRYKILGFSRNFGHQSAITAGVDYARGAAVVVMDSDLQDPPEVVVEMVEQWRAGYDVVYGKRLSRAGESWFKLFTARWFYRLFKAMIPIEVPLDAGDFRLMSRQVVVVLRQLRETHRFVRGIVSWVGFKQTAVLYDRPGRAAGDTKYPLRKMVRFAIDGITSFSILPLRFATYLGMVISVFSVLYGMWAVFAHLFLKETVQGWTATVVLVALFASVQLLMTGILGEYIGRIYEQVKLRPLYVVADRVNLAPSKDTDELDAFDVRASLHLPARAPVPEPPMLAPDAAAPAAVAPPREGTLGRPQTLLGVSPQPIAPAPFPAVPQTSTVVMPVLASKEGAELANAMDLDTSPSLNPDAVPGIPPAATSYVPPPSPLVTAAMKPIPRRSSMPPPLPKRSNPSDPESLSPAPPRASSPPPGLSPSPPRISAPPPSLTPSPPSASPRGLPSPPKLSSPPKGPGAK